MENASKALIMAGSILLTIMVVGMLIYFLSQYRQFPQAQTEAERLAQVSKFNMEYESYDKKEMYGTEVATVVNKVIDNNKKYADQRTGELKKGESNHYIDVEITVNSDIQKYAIQYYEVQQPDEDTKSYVAEDTHRKGTIVGYINGDRNKKVEYNLDEKTFTKGQEISLLRGTNSNSTVITLNQTIEEFFKDTDTVRIQLISGGTAVADKSKFDSRNYTEVYSGFTDFKRKYFKCTEIGYDEDTQMVNLLVFEELEELHAEDKEA